MSIYEKILIALQEYAYDPEMGLDHLSKTEIETLAEIAADVAKEITEEAEGVIITKLYDVIDHAFGESCGPT